MQFPDHPLWDFALATYGSSGVAPACLALQEAHQIDVNILLTCAWLGTCGKSVSAENARQLMEAVNEWHHDVVRGLRQVRKRMKESVDSEAPDDLQLALRARLQKLEIDTEHLEQLRLAAKTEQISFEKAQPGSKTVFDNMSAYLHVMVSNIDAESRRQLEKIAEAVSLPAGS